MKNEQKTIPIPKKVLDTLNGKNLITYSMGVIYYLINQKKSHRDFIKFLTAHGYNKRTFEPAVDYLKYNNFIVNDEICVPGDEPYNFNNQDINTFYSGADVKFIGGFIKIPREILYSKLTTKEKECLIRYYQELDIKKYVESKEKFKYKIHFLTIDYKYNIKECRKTFLKLKNNNIIDYEVKRHGTTNKDTEILNLYFIDNDTESNEQQINNYNDSYEDSFILNIRKAKQENLRYKEHLLGV